MGILTLQELHQQLVNPDREPFIQTVNIIKRLRAADNEKEQKAIKGELPAFTPGAMVDTKEAKATPEQKNIRYSGFMQVDIDLQDNKNMNDADAVRDKLAGIPYIALAAISARGKGVWGLVALAEPEKFMQYIDQVHGYFKDARVTLDNSKGKNPTELRYFTPDPGAILKTKYELMPLLRPPPASIAKVKPMTPRHNQPTGSTFADLQKWVNETTGFYFEPGQRHYYLFWLAYAIRKNGASESDVYSAIYSLIPQNEVKSNCILGGINHANNKGIYTPQTPLQPIVPPQPEALPQPTATSEPRRIPEAPELIKKGENWHDTISQLETYFANIELPAEPVKLNQCSTITNIHKFIEGHLCTVKANNGNPYFLPYLERLQTLKHLLN